MDKALQRLICCVSVFASATFSPAAQGRKAFADVSMYENVMQRVFKTSLAAPPDGSLIVLRFSHGKSKEFQVAFAETPAQGAVSIERWRIPESAPSIWIQLSQRVEANPGLTSDDAARNTQIQHETGTLPASSEVARLVSMHHSLSLPLIGRTDVHLDGAQYLLRIRSVGEDIEVRLDGPADPSESKEPTIRWMGQLRKAIENSSLKSSG